MELNRKAKGDLAELAPCRNNQVRGVRLAENYKGI